ncbi:MAG: hypothetical protein MZU95_16770 [Desulfomicrobium escambiense]|nr:hypothetical protein [Desulfomicrobium escambiense]
MEWEVQPRSVGGDGAPWTGHVVGGDHESRRPSRVLQPRAAHLPGVDLPRAAGRRHRRGRGADRLRGPRRRSDEGRDPRGLPPAVSHLRERVGARLRRAARAGRSDRGAPSRRAGAAGRALPAAVAERERAPPRGPGVAGPRRPREALGDAAGARAGAVDSVCVVVRLTLAIRN